MTLRKGEDTGTWKWGTKIHSMEEAMDMLPDSLRNEWGDNPVEPLTNNTQLYTQTVSINIQ
jgi:hypothetical protein